MGERFRLPVRADLEGVGAYGAPQLGVPARLNVNENPFALPPSLARAMGDAVAGVACGLNRYPDRDADELRARLAGYLSAETGVEVGVGQVWAANGSNEVLHQLFLAFGGPGRTALTFEPTYSMYPEYARDTFTGYRALPRRGDFTVDPQAATDAIADLRPSIVLLTSPNNPTGTALPLDDIRQIAAAARAAGAVLVVDEAYAEFRHAEVASACTLFAEFENLVVCRTMSKAFALAGARLGYAAAADPTVVDVLKVVRLPYHLSAVTQVVAITALDHVDVLQGQVDLLRRERDDLAQWLTASGFEVAPSDANFVLFGRFVDRGAVWHSLLDDGVLIRQVGPDGWLRVSIGTPEENDRFRSAMSRLDPQAARRMGGVSAGEAGRGTGT